LAWRARAL